MLLSVLPSIGIPLNVREHKSKDTNRMLCNSNGMDLIQLDLCNDLTHTHTQTPALCKMKSIKWRMKKNEKRKSKSKSTMCCPVKSHAFLAFHSVRCCLLKSIFSDCESIMKHIAGQHVPCVCRSHPYTSDDPVFSSVFNATAHARTHTHVHVYTSNLSFSIKFESSCLSHNVLHWTIFLQTLWATPFHPIKIVEYGYVLSTPALSNQIHHSVSSYQLDVAC